ncbi:hypothetical protein ACVBE9_11930 [Eionea flava]
MKAKLSPYYYPTDIALVDDNSSFLDILSASLSPKFSCKTFTDPVQALRYANNQSYRHLSALFTGDRRWQENVFRYLSNKQFDPSKNNELSVVIVDYDMPSIDGITFCKQLASPSVRKILLTGCASSSEVVAAFNDNIIDYYIDKNSDDLLNDVQHAVTKMQKSYFHENLKSLMMSFMKKEAPCFLDSQLAEYFDETCISLRVNEYYFMPETSRFILRSSQKDTLLIIASDKDIEEHINIIKEEDGPTDWIEQLLTQQYVPFFNSNDGFYTPETQINKNPLLKATVIKGKEHNYYCALVDNHNVVYWDFSKK